MVEKTPCRELRDNEGMRQRRKLPPTVLGVGMMSRVTFGPIAVNCSQTPPDRQTTQQPRQPTATIKTYFYSL